MRDASGVGVEVSMTLPGVTVLFGRNGAGKSLLIEYLDSLLAPCGEFRGRQTADSEMIAAGWVYLDPRATGGWSEAASWLRDLAEWSADGPVMGCDVDPADLAVALESSGWLGLSTLLATGPVPQSPGNMLVNAVTSFGLLAYQNFETGSIHLAVKPSDAERLRLLAEMVLEGSIGEGGPPDDGTLAHQFAVTLAESTGEYVNLAEIVTFPSDLPSYHRLRAEHPRVMWIRDDPQDLERIVDEAVPEDRWRLLDDGRSISLSEDVATLLESIEQRANAVAPRFLQERGSIRITAHTPTSSGVRPGVAIRFQLADEGSEVDYRHLGAGLRRWLGASVQVACTELGRRSGRLRRTVERRLRIVPEVVLLVDEPELHLHPDAQRDIAEWLVQRHREGALVLAASHSPALLDLPSQLASLVAVVRTAGQTTLYDMTSDVLDAVDDLAGALGFDRHSWLHAVRGVLVVEGEHDLRIIRHFCGREFAEARVLPLPLRGSGNVMAMIESEFLGRAHVPMRVVFDHTSADAFRRNEMPDRARTPEERKLVQFLHERRAGMDVEPIPYEEPDILCALPSSAVRRAYPDARFDGWQDLIEAWTTMDPHGRPGFKPYVLRRMRVGDKADDFVDRVLLHVRDEDRPSGALRRTIDSALASLAGES